MTKEGRKQTFELNPERITHWKQQKEHVLSVPKIHWSWCVGRMPQKVLRWEWTGRKKRWRGKCMSEEGTHRSWGKLGIILLQ